MNATEKAVELVEKVLPDVRGADRYGYNLDSISYFIAKQIAKVICDEVISVESELTGFYQDVKLEIEKL